MSIQSEITRLEAAKSDLKAAIEAKGVPVPNNALIDEYSLLVDQIAMDTVPIFTGTFSGGNYTGTVQTLEELKIGQLVVMVPNTTATSGDTSLNLNGWGNVALARVMSNNAASYDYNSFSGCIQAGKPVLLQYDGSRWVLVEHPKPAKDELGIDELETAIAEKAPLLENIVEKTSTFRVTASDLGKTFLMVNTSDVPERYVSVPTDAQENLPIGFCFYVRRWGSGEVIVETAGSAATINGKGYVYLGDQYVGVVSVVKVRANEWAVNGGIA